MRFVHHDEADLEHVEVGAEKLGAEPLGGDIEQLAVAVSGVVERQVHLPPGHPGVDAERLDARRHLEADGLAAAGGHYGEHVASR